MVETPLTATQKAQIVEHILSTTDPRNQGWMRAYLEANIDSCVAAVRAGTPLEHGFRGLEVQEAMQKLGVR